MSAPRDIRAFEGAMRELGYSRSEATGLASHGFKALKNGATVDEDPMAHARELAEAIRAEDRRFSDRLSAIEAETQRRHELVNATLERAAQLIAAWTGEER
jgi:hypothetical protein